MTKSQITKLGKAIRKKLQLGEDPTKEMLNNLQTYRKSYKDDVSAVFERLTSISKEVRKDSITAFRIKRIESILSKIKRQPTMALGNMGDIAGCRVLLYNENSIQKLIAKLNLEFDVKYYNDYLEDSKEDGYRGYHLYITSPINDSRLIEIQIRTVESHKWASMVEIIDILYDLKIKEGQGHPDFERFHILLAKKKSLNIHEQQELIKIDDKYHVHSKLNEVFIKNHLSIWKDWIELKSKENNLFIIEVDESKSSNISSYESYDIAETAYFDKFRENNFSNFVLTKIEKANFKRICIAYASYVLIKHDYLNDWITITSDIIDNLIEHNQKEELEYYAKYTQRNIADQLLLLRNELNEVNKYKADPNFEFDYKGWTEWLDELKERTEKIQNIYDGEIANTERSKNFFTKLFGG